jgi:hypothetical protein
MTQYMMMIKMREDAGSPPPELFAAMEKYIGAAMTAGRVVSMGGLLPSAEGARVTGSGGKIVTTHGPFAETTELIGGFAILEYDTLDEAIGGATEFIQLHVDNWPGFEGTSEIRPLDGNPGQEHG